MARPDPVALLAAIPRALLSAAFAPLTAAVRVARDITDAARATEPVPGAERIEGFAHGYAEGHRQGFTDGRSRGYEEGHRRAMEQVRADLRREPGPLDKPWWTGAAKHRIPLVAIDPPLPRPRRR